jgi:hypothetical protein
MIRSWKNLAGAALCGALAAGLCACATLGRPAPRPPIERDCDLVIAEASLGGVAAALQAARLGVKTCLTSMTDWVGGQLAVQAVSAIDEPYQFPKADKEFLARSHAVKDGRGWVVGRDRYSDNPHADEADRSLQPFIDSLQSEAGCWVSRHCFRPSEGDRRLKEMLQPFIDKGLLTVYYETVPKRVKVEGGRIVSADFIQRSYTRRGPEPYARRLSREILDWYDEKGSREYSKRRVRLTGKLFIDATETGELIVLSGAKSRLGSVDDPAGPADAECVMGFVYPIALRPGRPSAPEMSRLAAARDPAGLEPFDITDAGRGAEKFKFWKDDPRSKGLSVYDYRIISEEPSVTMMNWNPGNDYSGRNLIIPADLLGEQLQDWKGGIRVEALAQAEDRALAFARWLNEQPEVKWLGRGVTPIFDLHAPDNFFGTGTGLSKFPYIRETRRMEGYRGFYVRPEDVTTDQDALGTFPDGQYSNFYDSVGIGSYPLDIRRCPGGRSLSYPKRYGNHYQIPLRALISSNVANLMSANKTLAVSQIANAAYRLQPTEWNAGFGAGTAAAVALRHGVDAHGLMEDDALIREVQTRVVDAGGRVMWFSDALPPRP